MAGDERHNVVAQHKCRTVLAKRSLGVITLLEDFVDPSDSIRSQRSRTGWQVFRAPWHLDARLPVCNSSTSRNIYNRGNGVAGAAMCHRREITQWTDLWGLERFTGVVLFFRQVFFEQNERSRDTQLTTKQIWDPGAGPTLPPTSPSDKYPP
jgi:hypothetical protein